MRTVVFRGDGVFNAQDHAGFFGFGREVAQSVASVIHLGLISQRPLAEERHQQNFACEGLW